MPFQLILPWIVMIPMIYGSSLVNVPLLLAFLFAAIGLSAMHIVAMTKKEDTTQSETEAAPAEA